MGKIIFAIMLLMPASAFSQSVESTKFKRVTFGIVCSPDYCYRLLNYHSSNGWLECLRNEEEIPTIGYTAGLGIKMDLTGKITFETGLYLSIKGEQNKKDGLTWVTTGSDYPVKSRTRFHYKYIDIPFKVQYFLGSKKIKSFVSAGFSATIFFFFITKVIAAFSDGHKTSENSSIDAGYRKFNLVAVAGVGIKYDVSQRIYITLEPVYRQFINTILVDANAKEYPFSIGTNFGLFYTLKKK